MLENNPDIIKSADIKDGSVTVIYKIKPDLSLEEIDTDVPSCCIDYVYISELSNAAFLKHILSTYGDTIGVIKDNRTAPQINNKMTCEHIIGFLKANDNGSQEE